MLNLKKEKQKKMDEIVEKEVSNTGKLRFQRELPKLQNNLKEFVPQAKFIPDKDKKNIMNFTVEYRPEKDSYWYGGIYTFSFNVPDTFPFNPPKVMCLTKVYHPNIDFDGNVCLNILKDGWNSSYEVSSCIAGVYYLFTKPNPDDPLNHEVAKIMRENIEQIKSNVKKTPRGGYCFGQQYPCSKKK